MIGVKLLWSSRGGVKKKEEGARLSERFLLLSCSSHLHNRTSMPQTVCVSEIRAEKESSKAASVCVRERERVTEMSSTPPTSIHVQCEGEVRSLRVDCATNWHYLVA